MPWWQSVTGNLHKLPLIIPKVRAITAIEVPIHYQWVHEDLVSFYTPLHNNKLKMALFTVLYFLQYLNLSYCSLSICPQLFSCIFSKFSTFTP